MGAQQENEVKLATALSEACLKAVQAAERSDDRGTCNLDNPILNFQD